MTRPAAKLTVTAKGQMTLRRAVLDHLGVSPGETVDVTALPGGRVELRATPRGRIEDVFGMLWRPGQRTVTIETMNEVVAKGWAGELEGQSRHDYPDPGDDKG